MKNLLLFLSGIFLIGFATAQQYAACPMGGMMYGYNGGYGYTVMILSWVVTVLIIVLLIAAIYWLINSANKANKKR